MNDINTKTMKKISCGRICQLRRCIPDDFQTYLYWQSNGEWLQYDAPWEADNAIQTPDGIERYRTKFMKRCEEDQSSPFRRATIINNQDKPVGWVSRYVDNNNNTNWYVGIDICENDYMNKGIGTEALLLWINYLFEESDIHKVSLNTWSYNKRMIHVAEKIQMIKEGIEREKRQWKNNWIHRYHFGILRDEWRKAKIYKGVVQKNNECEENV